MNFFKVCIAICRCKITYGHGIVQGNLRYGIQFISRGRGIRYTPPIVLTVLNSHESDESILFGVFGIKLVFQNFTYCETIRSVEYFTTS